VAGADVRTFLFADMRGYTRFTQELGDDAASALAGRFAELVGDTVAGFDGELLELRGDEALCVFRSARQALRTAVELQRQLRTGTDEEPAFPLGVGMGLDAGEAVPTHGGYRGGALNLAARLCGAARGGEILATERVVGLTGPVQGLHWESPRAARVKGMHDLQRVVEITPDDPIPPPPPRRPERVPPNRRRKLGLAAGGALLLVVVALMILLGVGRGGTTASIVATPPRSLAEIDPRLGRVVGDVTLPAPPESLAAGFGRIWIGEQGGTVSAVRISTLRPHGAPVGVGIDPMFVATGATAVWVFDAVRNLAELNPSQSAPGIVARRTLWRCAPNQFLNKLLPACGGGGLAVIGNTVWVGHAVDAMPDSHNGVLDLRSASTLESVGHVPHVAIGTFAAGEGGLWSFGGVGMEVDRVDLAGRSVVRIPLTGQDATYTPAGVAVGFGYAWVASPLGSLYRCSSDGTYTRFQLPSGLTDIVASPTALWASLNDGRVLEIDPFKAAVEHIYKLGNADAVALVYTDGRVWVALGS
jgi:class 3 adenylate cyclase